MKEIVVGLSLIGVTHAFVMPHMIQDCRASSHQSQAFIDQSISMGSMDAIIFLILTPINFLSQLLIVMTFIRYRKVKEMREQPLDILLWISVCELFLMLHYFVSGVEHFQPGSLRSKSVFCQTNAFISVMFNTAEFVCNLFFVLFFVMQVKRGLLSSGKNYPLIQLLIISVISVAFTVTLFLKGQLGKSLFGTCSVDAVSNLPLVGPLILVMFILVASLSIIYFKKRFHAQEATKDIKAKFINQFYHYLVCVSIVWSIAAFFNFMAVCVCTFQWDTKYFTWTITVYNISKTMTPFVLTYIRLRNPFIAGKVIRLRQRLKKYYIRKIRKATNTSDQLIQPEPSVTSSIASVASVDNINKIFTANKTSLSQTIITGIYCYLKRHVPYQPPSMSTTQDLTKEKLKRGRLISKDPEDGDLPDPQEQDKPFRFALDQTYLHDYHQELLKEHVVQNYSLLDAVVECHFPKSFAELLAKDSQHFCHQESFDLTLNLEQVIRSGQAEGGAGGDWFFFSEDKRVVLKQMSQQDFQTMVSLMPKYSRYLRENPYSMVSRVYGLFTIRTEIAGEIEQYHIYMQRNLARLPSQYVLRTYDVKGSEVNRQTLTKGYDQAKQNRQIKGTLKDLDFNELEGTLQVSKDIKANIKESLYRDSQFFMQMQILDYSLIVFVVDHESYVRALQEEGEDQKVQQIRGLEMNQANQLMMVPSISQAGVYYHLGVIDYLQKWTLKKQLEKNTKQMLALNPFLDVSAQSPTVYAPRFQRYMDKILAE